MEWAGQSENKGRGVCVPGGKLIAPASKKESAIWCCDFYFFLGDRTKNSMVSYRLSIRTASLAPSGAKQATKPICVFLVRFQFVMWAEPNVFVIHLLILFSFGIKMALTKPDTYFCPSCFTWVSFWVCTWSISVFLLFLPCYLGSALKVLFVLNPWAASPRASPFSVCLTKLCSDVAWSSCSCWFQ